MRFLGSHHISLCLLPAKESPIFPMSAEREIAEYNEALELLSRMARGGDVRAAVALAGHLRTERRPNGKPRSAIDELAARRPKSPRKVAE
jgi:hypothetical protein